MERLHPDTWFTPPLGSDGVMHSREDIRAWYHRLVDATDRVRIWPLGTSTEGNPIDALVIADDVGDAAFASLRRHRADRVRALIGNLASARDDHVADRPVVLVTSGIHATEIGGPQSIPHLVHWLATSDDATPTAVRERLVTIIVPVLNPDGMDMVHRWHQTTTCTSRQGQQPPLLYHRFAGHDNNRDWVMRNLVETRVLMDSVHRDWLPHVTLDQHQMGKHGARFALPPFCDPWDPCVPPALIAAGSTLGQGIAADMTLQGLAGVQIDRWFDAYEPSRAIQHYRGGVRILTEGASVDLAHAINVTEKELRDTPQPQTTRPTQGQPLPWPGGAWTLNDIVRYQLAATRSMLTRVAGAPRWWLEVQRQAMAPIASGPTFSIPIRVGDRGAQRRLHVIIDASLRGPEDAGDAVSDRIGAQPLATLARAVLQPVEFPEEHGPASYDMTTHHLPMLMGALVQGHGVEDVPPATEQPHSATGDWIAIDPRSHLAPSLIERALAAGATVVRSAAPIVVADAVAAAGTWIVPYEVCADLSSDVTAIRVARRPSGASPMTRRGVVLVALPGKPNADLGWTRLWLTNQGVPFLDTRIEHLERLDPDPESTVLILPDSAEGPAPDAIETLRAFLVRGGEIIAIGISGRALAPALLPGVTAVDTSRLRAPGALLRLALDPEETAWRGLDANVASVFASDGAFSLSDDTEAASLARYAAPNPVVSGWMAGVDRIAGTTAIVHGEVGAGRLWAFGFRPLFRAQALVTSPLLHALLYRNDEGGTG